MYKVRESFKTFKEYIEWKIKNSDAREVSISINPKGLIEVEYLILDK